MISHNYEAIIFLLKWHQLISQYLNFVLSCRNDMERLYQEISKCVSFTNQHTKYINCYSSSNSNIQYMLSTTYHLYGCVVLSMIHSSNVYYARAIYIYHM